MTAVTYFSSFLFDSIQQHANFQEYISEKKKTELIILSVVPQQNYIFLVQYIHKNVLKISTLFREILKKHVN